MLHPNGTLTALGEFVAKVVPASGQRIYATRQSGIAALALSDKTTLLGNAEAGSLSLSFNKRNISLGAHALLTITPPATAE